jgi:hypothetical protein
VTIQTVSFAADAVMLVVAAGLVVLAVTVIVRLVQRRWRSAAGTAGVACAVLVFYCVAMVASALFGGLRQLRPGDGKCFDDWCAGMVAARRDAAAGTLLVDVRLQNRGLHAMRSNLARAYLELPGGGEIGPRDGSGLQTRLQPGERADVWLTFVVPGGPLAARFVVVEGGGGLGPGTFEIGGEGSPFHSVAGWPL